MQSFLRISFYPVCHPVDFNQLLFTGSGIHVAIHCRINVSMPQNILQCFRRKPLHVCRKGMSANMRFKLTNRRIRIRCIKSFDTILHDFSLSFFGCVSPKTQSLRMQYPLHHNTQVPYRLSNICCSIHF